MTVGVAGGAPGADVGAAPLPLGAERLRILLVEDSPVLVDRLAELLGQTPEVGELRTVDRETAAVEALGPWDVVILDLHLKQGTGFGVLRALRRRPELNPVVVVLTNHDVPGYRRRADALGVQHFLDKARDFDRLVEVLRGVHRAHAEAAGN